jgi:hypothetical protein
VRLLCSRRSGGKLEEAVKRQASRHRESRLRTLADLRMVPQTAMRGFTWRSLHGERPAERSQVNAFHSKSQTCSDVYSPGCPSYVKHQREIFFARWSAGACPVSRVYFSRQWSRHLLSRWSPSPSHIVVTGYTAMRNLYTGFCFFQ